MNTPSDTPRTDAAELNFGEMPGLMKQMERELKAARAELAEIRESFASVMREECGAGEKHCTCVPALRAELAALKAQPAYMIDQKTGIIMCRTEPQPPAWGPEMERPDGDGKWWWFDTDIEDWIMVHVSKPDHRPRGRYRRALPPPMPMPKDKNIL